MKRLVLSLAVAGLAATVPGRAEKIDLGTGKSLHAVVPESWTSTESAIPPEAPPGAKGIRYVPKSGSNDAVLVTVIPVPDDRFNDPASLKALVEEATEEFVAGSVEGKANIKEFKIGSQAGYSVTFTDANLVGKPSVKEDYKALTACFVYFGDHVLIYATVFTDDVAGKNYTEGLRIVKSLSLDLPRNTL